MADDKKDKDKKTKSGKSGGGGFFPRFLGSLFEQGINKFTRPIVEKWVGNLPDSVVQSIKKLGLDKALSALSVAFSTVIPESKLPFGDKINDIIKELSAEVEAAINLKSEGKLSASGADAGGKPGKDRIAAFLLYPRFEKEFEALFKAYADLDKLKDKDGKNISKEQREKIDIFIAKMDPKSLYLFLRLEKRKRKEMIERFVEKVNPRQDSSIEDSIKEIKAQIAKAKEVYEQAIKPELMELDKKLSDDSKVGKAALGFLDWSEKLKQNAKKFKENGRS